MPKQRGWQLGDICYETGRRWRSLVHLIRPTSGKMGHRMTEVRLQFKDDTVLLILKKDTPKGPQIAFLEAESFDTALWVLEDAVKAKRVPWKRDRWRTMRIDEKKT